jgi:hypothetical protein
MAEDSSSGWAPAERRWRRLVSLRHSATLAEERSGRLPGLPPRAPSSRPRCEARGGEGTLIRLPSAWQPESKERGYPA